VGICVQVVDEFGESESEHICDPQNHLHRLLATIPESRFLQYIDWFGDTIFNQEQVRDFLKEWGLLLEFVENEDEKALVEQIADLAKSIVGKPHTYLKFDGD